MCRAILLAVALAACGPGDARPVVRAASAPATPAAPVELPTYQIACEDLGGAPSGKEVRYEFEAAPLPASVDGPRVATRSRAGVARSPGPLHDALVRAQDELAACWKWAQAASGLPATRAEVAFTVDPWGRIIDAEATTSPPAGDALDACLAEALRATHVDGISTRTTRVRATLSLELADQPAWPEPPPRPTPPVPAPRLGRVCAPVVDLPADERTIAAPLAVSDWDPARASHRHAGMKVGCAVISAWPGKDAARAALAANAGAHDLPDPRALRRFHAVALAEVDPAAAIAALRAFAAAYAGEDADAAEALARGLEHDPGAPFTRRCVN